MRPHPEAPPDVVRRGFRILGHAVREQPRIFAVSALGSTLFGSMIAGQAYVLGEVTQRLILPAFRDGRTTAGAVATAALAVLAVSLLKAMGVIARRLGAGIMQYRLNASYRRRVTRQYLRLPLSWHQAHPTGQLLSNANADVEATWQVIAPFPFFIGTLVLLLVTGVLLVATDPVLAVVGFVVFPALALVNAGFSRLLAPRMTQAQELRGQVSARAHESFDGALVVKTLGREDAETASFRAVSERLRDQLIGVGRVRAVFDPLMETLPAFGVLAVLLVGTARVESGVLTTGELVRVAYLFTLLALPLRAIAWVLGSLPTTVVGWRRLRDVLDADGHTRHGERSLEGSGPVAVELAGLSVGYAGVPVVREVDLRVAAGRTVALVGPTGAGKSTLVSALLRLLEPVDGAVRLDGVDVRELAPGALAGAAALVPQSTFLFDDTVRGNVTLGADVADEDVWQALRIAQADGFVAALPRGLDTLVGERGASLSGGQRQRVALARALVRRPRLLVLDDATSSVDPQVEAAILRGLRDAGLPSTVVLVAYRRASIELADEVVFLDEGTVLARGTHEQLLERSPGYLALVTAYEQAERDRQAEREAEVSAAAASPGGETAGETAAAAGSAAAGAA